MLNPPLLKFKSSSQKKSSQPPNYLKHEIQSHKKNRYRPNAHRTSNAIPEHNNLHLLGNRHRHPRSTNICNRINNYGSKVEKTLINKLLTSICLSQICNQPLTC